MGFAATARFTSLLTLTVLYSVSATSHREVPTNWKQQILDRQGQVDSIIDHVLNGAGKGDTYNELALLTDLYGHRLSGTQELEDAIDYVKGKLEGEFGVGNVYTEDVMIPRWVRGKEWAQLTLPVSNRIHDMYIMGIGKSIGTQDLPDAEGGNLTAPIIIVKSFDELEDCNDTKIAYGKIVVYNQPWTGYGNVYMYRSEGASRAAKCGAKAALVRSLTQFSIYSPHTGTQSYHEDLPEDMYIPAACITTEDADMMQRLWDAEYRDLEVTLHMEARNEADVEGRNLYVELPGTDTEYADEYVIFGGHIDSWDVGAGAMDDGGGVAVSWQVLQVIKDLDLPHKRTLRAIFWTAEEVGAAGADKFFENHKDESVSLIMESDAGTFTPTGLGFHGSDASREIMQEILNLLEAIDTTNLTEDMSGSVDIRVWMDANFSAAVLNNVEGSDGYFYFHHTEGDTMTVEDTHDLDLCTILFTAVAYVVSDVDYMLPDSGELPVSSAIAMAATQPFLMIMLMVLAALLTKGI